MLSLAKWTSEQPADEVLKHSSWEACLVGRFARQLERSAESVAHELQLEEYHYNTGVRLSSVYKLWEITSTSLDATSNPVMKELSKSTSNNNLQTMGAALEQILEVYPHIKEQLNVETVS